MATPNALLEENQTLKDRVDFLERENQTLELKVKDLHGRLFGRTSEKLSPAQLRLLKEQVASNLFPEEEPLVAPPDVEKEPDAAEPPWKKKRRSRHQGRRPLPEHLPRKRIEIRLEPSERICACCDQPMQPIGEETTEELGRIPARWFVRLYVRTKYACRKCQEGVVTPELPPRPIEKGRAGADVLADILVSKYGDHLPLYRQAAIFRREGIDLSRSTLCDWVAESSFLLRPIVAQTKVELLGSSVIQSDDTPVRVQHPRVRGPTKRGYLWVYVGEEGEVVYDFTENRSRAGPSRFLAAYSGNVQADAYAGYNELFRREDIRPIGCWAHARRKFHEALDTAPEEAARVLLYIVDLYKIEAEARENGWTAQERWALRQKKALPILAELQEYLTQLVYEVLPKSPIGRAVAYTMVQWEALYRYTEDGRVEIDNNSAERAMRRVAVGRRNWLFAGSPAGGQRAAIVYSLIETCQRLDINPHEYLTDVLQRVCTHPASRIAELTPRGWKKARADKDRAATETLAPSLP